MRSDPVDSYRFTADTNSALPAQTKVHGVSLLNGTLTATAFVKLYDFKSTFKLVVSQTEADYDNSPTTEGTFVAGSGYAATDTITLSDGSLITVNTVTAGAVATFTVTTVGTTTAVGPLAGTALTQTSTSGVGTGFTLTPDTGNIVAASDPVAEVHAELGVGTTYQQRRNLKFNPPLYVEIAASLDISGASAVGYIYYTR